ncbi:MAG: hypothetical protein AB7O24_09010 [Kofleriaceae bacterium]
MIGSYRIVVGLAWAICVVSGTGCEFKQPPKVVAEVEKRSAYVRALSEREGRHDTWSLNSRHNFSFEEGMSNPVFIDIEPLEPKWFEVVRVSRAIPGTAVRWLNRNAHFRARGDSDMTLTIRGKVDVNQIYTIPRFELIVDGELVVSQVTATNGRFSITTTVPKETVARWIDIYLTFSALQDPVRTVGEPWVARLEAVEWEPVTPTGLQ